MAATLHVAAFRRRWVLRIWRYNDVGAEEEEGAVGGGMEEEGGPGGGAFRMKEWHK